MKSSLQSTLRASAIAAMVMANPTVGFAPTKPVAARIPPMRGASLVPRNALLENLPDANELSTAPFMKQVGYGSEMAATLRALNENGEDVSAYDTIKTSLEAQLSHSDGIRGFMVAYLTATDGDDIEDEKDPKLLLETLHGLLASSSSSEDLVSLMCMNVVMPVAMITMHQDPALSEASRMTAARGGRLLASVLESSPSIRANAEAIGKAASGERGFDAAEPKLVDYWKEFFGKWGYEDPQKQDIAATMKELLAAPPQ